MRKINVEKFVAADGTEFVTDIECAIYESGVIEEKVNNIPHIQNTPPFSDDFYDYIWYRLKSSEDLEALISYYGEDACWEPEKVAYPSWYCIKSVDSDIYGFPLTDVMDSFGCFLTKFAQEGLC